MNILKMSIFAALWSSGTIDCNAAPDAREIYRNSASSVVLIRTYDASGAPIAIGSGFFAQSGDCIVTNAHVVAGASKIEYVSEKQPAKEISAISAVSFEEDIALLVANGSGLPLSKRPPEVGEPIFVIGNPKGLSQTISDGIVSALRVFDQTSVVQITAPISPGSSGGPVLDAAGAVIGIASFARRDGQNLNFAVSSKHILALLERRETRPIASLKAKQRASGRGEGRVTIVKATPGNWGSGTTASFRNDEDYRVSKVLLRVLFYDDRKQDVKKLAGRNNQLEEMLGRKQGVNSDEKLMSILQRDPTTWTFDDLPGFAQYSRLKSAAEIYLKNRAGLVSDIHLTDVRAEIPEELKRVKARLEESKAKEIEFESKRVALEMELAQVREQIIALRESPRVLLDYQDIELNVEIDPKLTRSASFKVTAGASYVAQQSLRDFGANFEFRILDYEIRR